jgi:hypothetical protein
MSELALESIESTVTRLGVVLRAERTIRPNRGRAESGERRARGTANSCSIRARSRAVTFRASRIVEATGGSPDDPAFEPRGYALEPEAPYELRDTPGGYGCEDPRVTFLPRSIST